MTPEQALPAIVGIPAASFMLLGFTWLVGLPLTERIIGRITSATFLSLTAASAWLSWAMLAAGRNTMAWSDGMWFRAGEYSFALDLAADRLSMPLIVLTAVLVGLVGLFSVRYLHRERGFFRFFLLLHLFALGSMLIFAAGSFDLLIGGWELVGISSALLIAFFNERRDPVRNAMHVFAVYRVGDLGLLLGVFFLHYLGRSGETSVLFPGSWPQQSTTLTPNAAAAAGLLFLFAAAAKSSQAPFFGWLPRAMEGPTPSSAIFYGAISIHAGAYLLLRIEPVWRSSPVASGAVVAVGLLSAVLGTLSHRVAADAKTSIAYAAMTQLGIVFVEIGLGFPRLALVHITGHAIVRTLQFLRAPSALRDYRRMHAAAGGRLARTGSHFEHVMPESVRLWAYRVALDRGFYDVLASRMVVRPVMAVSRWLGSFEPVAKQPSESSFNVLKDAVLMQETKA